MQTATSAPATLRGCGPPSSRSVGCIRAYSFGTSSVNVGNVNLDWIDGSPNHPVIGQNMFRLKDGRFEQIGQSWLKHGFCALQLLGCGACATQAGCLSFLKPGCRDPYSASLSGAAPTVMR